jgi:predicted RNase H-like HicB family nuclease
MKRRIYGYYFAIKFEKTNDGYIAYAPGVGGIYEEGENKDEAIENAYESACAIIEIRVKTDNPITEDSEFLKVLTSLPHREYIQKFDKMDGYLTTGSCMHVDKHDKLKEPCCV